MTYTQSTLENLRSKAGSLLQKIYTEFGLVKTEIDTLTGRSLVRRWNMTPNMGTDTTLATTGITLKTGATYYAKFYTDVPLTITGMVTYQTEAYVYNVSDAKIELKTEAASPVTKVTYTYPQAGRAAKTIVKTTPTSASLAANDALDIVITATGSSGAGFVKIELLYTVD